MIAIPDNDHRDPEPEPERCQSCREPMDGEYCPRHCGIYTHITAMLSDIEYRVGAKTDEMARERDDAYRLSLWRQIRDRHAEIQKLWKEIEAWAPK